jgi:ABC-type uncharacterized transport system fused permease/ATPase subunit
VHAQGFLFVSVCLLTLSRCSHSTDPCSVSRPQEVPSTGGLDNPDQRIGQDLPQMCTYLASVAKDMVSVPLQVAMYCGLTATAFASWMPPAMAFAFFVLGCVVQR